MLEDAAPELKEYVAAALTKVLSTKDATLLGSATHLRRGVLKDEVGRIWSLRLQVHGPHG